MSGFLQDLWESITGLPELIFGERMHDGWGVAFAIYTAVVVIAFAIGGYRSVHELLKALDIRFDKEKLERYNLNRESGTPAREIDWLKARKQQVRSVRFTIPFGLLVLAALCWWVRGPFTLLTYFQLAA